MQRKKLIVEKSKDGKNTCKYEIDGSYKYLYSKYSPDNLRINYTISEDADYIIILGLGLGYELNLLRAQTQKQIYVIEADKAFYELLEDKKLEKVTIFVGEDYKKVCFVNKKIQFISNSNLIECNIPYYKRVMNYFRKKRNYNKRVIVYDHPTIAKDCASTFEELGYDVIFLQLNEFKKVYYDILEYQPDYIFTVNFLNVLADICEQIPISYISWTVDTPCYTLYSKSINYNHSILFIYDEAIVEDLILKGAQNVFYMPVAANVTRLNKIVMNHMDVEKYSCDISFLGSCCSHNEYMNILQPKLSISTQHLIENIINVQMGTDKFIIKEMVDDNLINLIGLESPIHLEKFLNLPPNVFLSFIIGRYHSYVERTKFMSILADKFDTKIYGEKGWLLEKDYSFDKVHTHDIEHFTEMPKAFRCSKINLNITRSFVESGLPMRIFDVLGSNAFLVSNNKLDLKRLFSPGKDLVIYRDIQDLIEIVQYYLVHSEERNTIRQHGYETVSNYHTFSHRLINIMEKVKEVQYNTNL